jgi:tetratricopeptide (TPR) repeat protein
LAEEAKPVVEGMAYVDMQYDSSDASSVWLIRQALDAPQRWIEIAQSFLQKGNAMAAAKAAEIAVSLSPTNSNALSTAGSARGQVGLRLLDQNRLAEAGQEFLASVIRLREAYRQDVLCGNVADVPLDRQWLAGSLAHLGLVYLRQDHLLDESEALCRASVRLCVQHPFTHQNLGRVLMKQDRDTEAEREFWVSIRLDPSVPDAQYDLGVLYTKLGRYEEAEKQYQSTLRIAPSHTAARQNLEAVKQAKKAKKGKGFRLW